MKLEVQLRVVGRINILKRAEIKCGRRGRGHRFLIRPFQSGNIREVRVWALTKLLVQKSCKWCADVLQIAAARGVFGLEFSRQAFETIAADKSLDDRKCKRERALEGRMQLRAVDVEPRDRIDAVSADRGADRRARFIKERRGEAPLQLMQRRHGAPVTVR